MEGQGRNDHPLAGFGLALVGGLVAALAVLVLFAFIANDVLEGETAQLDAGVLAWLQRFSSPVLDALARGVTALGSEGVAALLVVLVALLVWKRRWRILVPLILTVAGAQLLNDVLKGLFQRTRPAPVSGLIAVQAFSFPSGHAMVSAAFYLYLVYLSWRLLHGGTRVAVSAGLVGLVVLIGVSRLYLGVHYLTDVIAGDLAGFLWVDGVIIGSTVLAHRRRSVEELAPAHG